MTLIFSFFPPFEKYETEQYMFWEKLQWNKTCVLSYKEWLVSEDFCWVCYSKDILSMVSDYIDVYTQPSLVLINTDIDNNF